MRLTASSSTSVWKRISGMRHFYASDPHGNRLEFLEPRN